MICQPYFCDLVNFSATLKHRRFEDIRRSAQNVCGAFDFERIVNFQVNSYFTENSMRNNNYSEEKRFQVVNSYCENKR